MKNNRPSGFILPNNHVYKIFFTYNFYDCSRPWDVSVFGLIIEITDWTCNHGPLNISIEHSKALDVAASPFWQRTCLE